MQVTETLSDGLRRAYSVTVPAAEIESKWGAKLAEIGRTIRLPGFRPGKVPVNLVRQRYGASVMAEVMQDALSTAADQLVEERGLRPAGQPKIELAGQPDINAKAASDLSFNVELEILPEIVAPDLSALNLVRYRAEVALDKVEDTLSTMWKRIAAPRQAILFWLISWGRSMACRSTAAPGRTPRWRSAARGSSPGSPRACWA
jgi:trigger factor